MIIIGAMSTERVIGSGDGMPWDVPEEYARFLRFIEGQTVIIGRRSYRDVRRRMFMRAPLLASKLVWGLVRNQ